MQQRQSSNVHGPGHSGHFADTIWRQFIQSPAKSYALLAFIFLLLVGALISARLLDSTVSIHRYPIISSFSALCTVLLQKISQITMLLIEHSKTMSCSLMVSSVLDPSLSLAGGRFHRKRKLLEELFGHPRTLVLRFNSMHVILGPISVLRCELLAAQMLACTL